MRSGLIGKSGTGNGLHLGGSHTKLVEAEAHLSLVAQNGEASGLPRALTDTVNTTCRLSKDKTAGLCCTGFYFNGLFYF